MEVGELEGDERGKRCLFVSTVFGARKDDHILVLSAHPFFGSSLQQLSHSYFRTTHASLFKPLTSEISPKKYGKLRRQNCQ